MAKSHHLGGEQGVARPQVHGLLGKAWLSPGPSGCPSPSMKLLKGIKKWQQYIPGIKKKPAKCHSLKSYFISALLHNNPSLS